MQVSTGYHLPTKRGMELIFSCRFERPGLSDIEQEAVARYCSALKMFSDRVIEEAWISIVQDFTGGRPRCRITKVRYQSSLINSGFYTELMAPSIWTVVKSSNKQILDSPGAIETRRIGETTAEGLDTVSTQENMFLPGPNLARHFNWQEAHGPEAGIRPCLDVNNSGGQIPQMGEYYPPSKRLRQMQSRAITSNAGIPGEPPIASEKEAREPQSSAPASMQQSAQDAQAPQWPEHCQFEFDLTGVGDPTSTQMQSQTQAQAAQDVGVAQGVQAPQWPEHCQFEFDLTGVGDPTSTRMQSQTQAQAAQNAPQWPEHCQFEFDLTGVGDPTSTRMQSQTQVQAAQDVGVAQGVQAPQWPEHCPFDFNPAHTSDTSFSRNYADWSGHLGTASV